MNIRHPKNIRGRSFGRWLAALVRPFADASVLAFALLAATPGISANTYFVKNGGNDNALGTSDAEAWATIAKVNAQQLVPGDRVYFKRGSTWTGTTLTVNTQSLNSEAQRVIYGSYSGDGIVPGTGSRPVIAATGESCVAINGKDYVTIQDLELRTATFGVFAQNVHHIVVQRVKTFQTGGTGIGFQQGGYITVDNCEVSEHGNGGIYFKGSAIEPLHDGVISNCTVHDAKPASKADGIVLHVENTGPVYDGIGANFLVRDNLVYNCKENGYDVTSGTNITLERNRSYHNNTGSIVVGHGASNVAIRYHRAENEPSATTGGTLIIQVPNVTVEYSTFIGGSTTGTNQSITSPVVLIKPGLTKEEDDVEQQPEDVVLRNNVFVWNSPQTGAIFQIAPSNETKPSPGVQIPATIQRLTMKNNIWASRTVAPRMFFPTNRPPDYVNGTSAFVIRNNLYDNIPGNTWNVGSAVYNNFTAYKWQFDASNSWNELTNDPQFVDIGAGGAAAGDFHLMAASPARDAGTSTLGSNPEPAMLAEDFSTPAVSIPQNGARDIGAYEFPVTGAPAAPNFLDADPVSPNEVQLTWQDVTGETGYKLERKEGTGNFVPLASPIMDASSYPDQSVAPSTAYTYRIQAVNGAMSSPFTTSTEINTPPGGGGSPIVIDPDNPIAYITGATTSPNDQNDLSSIGLSGATGGTAARFIGDAAGDYVEFNFPSTAIPSGTYTVTARVRKASSMGIYKLTVDGAVLDTEDFFATAGAFADVSFGTAQISGTAARKFRFICDGQNLQSTGYTMTLDLVTLTPIGGQSPAATPTFNPAAGTYTNAATVTIATTTSGASIRYTIDGSTPSSTVGTIYSAPVTLSATATLQAIAYASGFDNSAVASGLYTIQAAAPVFAPAAGTYTSAQNVTITTTTFGASIRYTTDGSTPTSSFGTLYTGPVSIGATATLKAIAYKAGLMDSPVTSGGYIINLPPAATPTFDPAAGTYTDVATVTIATTTSGASIRYTTDGSTPTPTFGTIYSVPVTLNATATLQAIAFASGFNDSAVASGVYTIQAAAPVFAPAAGTYTSAQNVTITTTTSGATIRYTTDGSTPTSTFGTLYAGPVSIGATATLKAIAYKAGLAASPVTSGNYIINLTDPALKVWLKLDETAGTVAADGSGNGNNGTLLNGPAWVAGHTNNGLNFDKVDDLVNVGSAAGIDNMSAMTIAAWIKPGSTGEGGIARIVAKGASAAGFRFNMQGTNQLGFAADFATTDLFRTSAINALTLNQWAYVVVTWDGSATATNVRFYVNGTEVTSYATTTNGVGIRDNDSASDLYVGNDTTLARTFDGPIDGVRVYNRVLAPTEIEALFNSGAP